MIILAALTWFAPPFGSGGDQIAGIIPQDSPALANERRAVEEFGYPLTSRTLVVQQDPQGLSPFTQAASALEAVSVNQRPQRYPLLGALPVSNALPVVPGIPHRGTTVVTYLFMEPTASVASQTAAARRYIAEHLDHPSDRVVGIAGSVPARDRQATLVSRNLPLMEALTVLAVFVLVCLNFRSLAAPLLALTASAVAIGVTIRIAGIVGVVFGLSVPAELQPLIVALLLGIVTDYTIFYISGLDQAVAHNSGPRGAVTHTITVFTPIVAVAALTVAAGTGSLISAKSGFFRALGPALACAVLVGLLVSVTLIPALLTVLGQGVLWPRRADSRRDGLSRRPSGVTMAAERAGRSQVRLVRMLTRPRVAAVVLAGSVAVLGLATLPLFHLDLGVGFTQSLPRDDPVVRTSTRAAAGFAPGITSPTTLLVEGQGVGRKMAALRALQRKVQEQPGVAGVFGPEQAERVFAGSPDGLAGRLNIIVSRSGNAARMVVVLRSDPLEAGAISALERLRGRLPVLARESGLPDVRVSLAGDTALAAGLVEATTADLWRVSSAALAVNLLLLVVFLRALVAPLYLLASSVLALAASLGVTVWIFQDRLGHQGLTFYVPFAAAVLLVSLGSDYNIFGVGHIWEEARHRPLREAVVVALPENTRAIGAAAITLAVSFGLLALIPLRPFRELAVALSLGILVDALVVRSVVVPSLLTLVGSASAWPSRQFSPRRGAAPASHGSASR